MVNEANSHVEFKYTKDSPVYIGHMTVEQVKHRFNNSRRLFEYQNYASVLENEFENTLVTIGTHGLQQNCSRVTIPWRKVNPVRFNVSPPS